MKFPKFFKIFTLIIVMLIMNVSGNFSLSESTFIEIQTKEPTAKIDEIRTTMHNQLVNEVKNYIYQYAPTSKLDAEYLINICYKYELDIKFVLAQALLESHFGTKGVAAKTNSVWNVGTYDNGNILYKYKNPNESIEPYAILLTEQYLVNKELLALVQDKGFKHIDGRRYATYNRYEEKLRKIIIQIDMQTSISLYQGVRNLTDKEISSYFLINEQINNYQLQALN